MPITSPALGPCAAVASVAALVVTLLAPTPPSARGEPAAVADGRAKAERVFEGICARLRRDLPQCLPLADVDAGDPTTLARVATFQPISGSYRPSWQPRTRYTEVFARCLVAHGTHISGLPRRDVGPLRCEIDLTTPAPPPAGPAR